MPGAMCPKCGELTFWNKPFGKQCSKCGYKVFSNPNEGKGGKGKKCPICKKFTFFNGKCTSCGAHE